MTGTNITAIAIRTVIHEIRSVKHGDLVAGLLKVISRAQPDDPSSDDDDILVHPAKVSAIGNRQPTPLYTYFNLFCQLIHFRFSSSPPLFSGPIKPQQPYFNQFILDFNNRMIISAKSVNSCLGYNKVIIS